MRDETICCDFCGSSAISKRSDMETYQYKQQAYDVLVDYSVCNQCGEEVITTEQIHINEVRVREAKKKIDDPTYAIEFTKAELRRAFEKVIGESPFERGIERKRDAYGFVHYIDVDAYLVWAVLGETLKQLKLTEKKS